jgi:hypothetical protein
LLRKGQINNLEGAGRRKGRKANIQEEGAPRNILRQERPLKEAYWKTGNQKGRKEALERFLSQKGKGEEAKGRKK